MKSTIVVLAAMVFLLGCSAHYGNEAQYNDGDWYFLASAREVARIKADKLAFEKLKAGPAQTQVKEGSSLGYQGLIANLSGYNRYNFKLSGPETKSYLLRPGEQVKDFLLPGKYYCRVFQGGSEVGHWTFEVGPQQSTFMNQKYHWYVYADR